MCGQREREIGNSVSAALLPKFGWWRHHNWTDTILSFRSYRTYSNVAVYRNSCGLLDTP